MLATTLGKDFDLDQIWNEEKSVYEISEDIVVKTQNITMTTCGKNGFWTTAVAAAVLIP
jgi:arginine decarboxylase